MKTFQLSLSSREGGGEKALTLRKQLFLCGFPNKCNVIFLLLIIRIKMFGKEKRGDDIALFSIKEKYDFKYE